MPDVQPYNLRVQSTTSEKFAAGGVLALNTGVVTAAPLLSSYGMNSSGAGGIGVTMIGNGITVIVQALAAQDWFDDYKWAVWTCILFSIIICTILYIVALGNPELGVLNSLGSMYQAASNYGPLSKLGVFSRPGDVADTASEQLPNITQGETQ